MLGDGDDDDDDDDYLRKENSKFLREWKIKNRLLDCSIVFPAHNVHHSIDPDNKTEAL